MSEHVDAGGPLADAGHLAPGAATEVELALADAAGDFHALLDVAAGLLRARVPFAGLGLFVHHPADRALRGVAALGEHGRVAAPPDWLPVDTTIMGRVLLTGLPTRATLDPDVVEQTSRPGYRPLVQEQRIAQLLVVPVNVAGSPVGVLTVSRRDHEDLFTADDEAIAARAADRVALALDHARMRANAGQQFRLSDALTRLGEAALTDRSVVDFHALVVREVAYALQAEHVNVFLVETSGEHAVRSVTHGQVAPATRPRVRLTGTALAGHVDRGRHVVVHELGDDLDARVPTMTGTEVKSAASVALREAGRAAAILTIGRVTREGFTHGEQRFLRSIAHLVGAVMERAAAHGRLWLQAHTDALTGLANRQLLTARAAEAIERSRSTGASVALLLADLDGFKLVNDSLGHREGDDLLRSVARRLSAAVRPSDLVARIGGDEFAVLCTDADELAATRIAERLLQVLVDAVSVARTTVNVRASIGVAEHDGARAHSAVDGVDGLLQRADLAMYRAKAAGGNRVAVYDMAMHADTMRRHAIEQGLTQALRSDGLQLAYQPIVETGTGAIGGVEALVRWRHPTLGSLGPDEFVPVAEQSGLIAELDLWVLEQATRTARPWVAESLVRWKRPLAVNVSGRSLSTVDFVERFRRVLARTAYPTECLVVEVTETHLTDSAGSSALHQLAALGVSICVDDFGTGFASLVQLKRLPVGALKIDKSFTSGLGTDARDDAIIESTVSLARRLGLPVIAEGVETAEQLDALTAVGCTEAQGYLFARPAPADEIEPLLRAGHVVLPSFAG